MQIIDMPFPKETKKKEFKSEFNTKDMVKLEAKKDLPKVTREERLKR